MCSLFLLLVNVKKYLDYGYTASYELAGYAEWRLLFLLGACLFILGISNAPPTLLASQGSEVRAQRRGDRWHVRAFSLRAS